MEAITINGVLLSSMGVTLENGHRAELLAPAPLKEMVTNKDPRKHGTEVLTTHNDGTSALKEDERDVTLTFLIEGSDESDFLAKYDAFLAVLRGGVITLHTPALNRSFRLIYKNSTRFDNYLLKACRMSVKFLEPNPTNRGE